MTLADTAREYFSARIALAQTQEDRYAIRQEVLQLQRVGDVVLHQLEEPYHEAILQARANEAR